MWEATVWDGAGMAGGLTRVRQGGEQKALILADSKSSHHGGQESRQDGKGQTPTPVDDH